METVEQLLERLREDPSICLTPPLSVPELDAISLTIREELGLTVPDEFMRLLRITNGIGTQRGYLSDLQEVGEQNAIVWFMNATGGTSATGDFEIRYTPLPKPRTPTYFWLGYSDGGNTYAYDLALGGYCEIDLDDPSRRPYNADRSLTGLLRHMAR
jgi:hypothetical protein